MLYNSCDTPVTYWFFKRQVPLTPSFDYCNICLLYGSERRTHYETVTRAAHVCVCGPWDLFILNTAIEWMDEAHSEIPHVRKSTFMSVYQTTYREAITLCQSRASPWCIYLLTSLRNEQWM